MTGVAGISRCIRIRFEYLMPVHRDIKIRQDFKPRRAQTGFSLPVLLSAC